MASPHSSASAYKTVLNVGCGYPLRQKLHRHFHGPEWRELRLDLDPAVCPDIVCMTVAKLPGALPAGTRQLTATIKTEDPRGPLVEYALLALGPRSAYRKVLTKGQLNGLPGGFSGWLPIHPEFATQIHLTLTDPSEKPLDLFLATRLAEGQAAICAQARWLEFVVDAFPEASSQ
jgi:Family of unknown function (DUF6212)